jgi:hypothetical protein
MGINWMNMRALPLERKLSFSQLSKMFLTGGQREKGPVG